MSTHPSLSHQEPYDSPTESTVSSLVSESLNKAYNDEPHFSQVSGAPYFLNQKDLNDLGLTKEKSEILASRMKQWNIIKKRR